MSPAKERSCAAQADPKGNGLPHRRWFWPAVLGAVFLVLLGLGLWLLLRQPAAATAGVYSDGKLVAVLDLSEDRTLTVPYEGGFNVITVRDGKIAVTEADCRDQVCVRRGFQSGGLPIVCLPHRLEIRFGAAGDLDAALH